MANKIEYLSGARDDFDQSVDWYLQRSPTAASGFVSAVNDAVLAVLNDPKRFARTVSGCRSCSLQRYPFRVIFKEQADRIVIVAVAHAKRRPGYWRHRL